MARLRQFTRSLVSGYVIMGANIVFTLISVPLAFRYLSAGEFGLWAVTARLAGYIGLIDFGVSGAVSRILIDHKDAKDSQEYGQTVSTAILVSSVQGILIMLVGVGVALTLGPVFNIDPGLMPNFFWLTVGQAAILAVNFLFRVFPLILTAHQRYDIGNYGQAFSFVINLGVVWFFLRAGHGVFSLIYGQLAAAAFGSVVTLTACWRLPVLPKPGAWMLPTYRKFREVFGLSNDIFLFMVGAQLINASQVLLVSRFLGIEACAVWYACTQSFALLQLIIFRGFDYSTAALAEMMVRGEKERLFNRFRSLVSISGAAAVLAAIFFVLCNQPFVRLWTHGKMGWSVLNDILLAGWLILTVIMHAHIGLAGQTKQFKFMRYVFLCEGLFFVTAAAVSLRFGQFWTVIAASIVSTLLFSLPYGAWRTGNYFKIPLREVVVAWNGRALRVGTILLPLAGALYWLAQDWGPLRQLVLYGVTASTLGVWVFMRWGLSEEFRNEAKLRLSAFRTRRGN